MYNLGVRLDTLSGLVNPQSSTTSVRITVTDVNDNSPVFIYPLIHAAVVPAYFAAVSRETQLGTHLVTVKVISVLTSASSHQLAMLGAKNCAGLLD